MPEEIKKSYINKESHQNTSYDELYLEGIELLQKLSGSQWTDYNEHDPGVTILENMVYAITELEYKAGLPIENILRESKGKKLESGDNGFFLPSEILTTAPVVENDYRKLLIDQIGNVKNVWIKSQQEYNDSDQLLDAYQGLRGLYHIYVELYNYSSDPVTFDSDKQKVYQDIYDLYHANRNFCEDLYDITVLDPIQIEMNLQLTLEEYVDGEEVFSEVFYALSNYISSEVEFSPLWQQMDENISMNEIFNGPMLDNGFIKNSQLKEKPKNLSLQAMDKIITGIDGVVSVDFFELHKQKEGLLYLPLFRVYLDKSSNDLIVKEVPDDINPGKTLQPEDHIIGVNGISFSSPGILLNYIQENKYTIYELVIERAGERVSVIIKPQALHYLPVRYDKAPLLASINTANQKNLFFKSKGEYFQLDLHEFFERLEDKQEQSLSTFKAASRSFNEMALPQGTDVEINSYYPLRKQFPVAYGIGEYGLPSRGLPPKRYAQAKQLKAYLLPMDQLMANFLKQLTSLYQLYSVNPTDDLNSYFYQELEDMPNLVELIKEYHLESDKSALERWEKTLTQLNTSFDQSALQRLNEVADALLARFGETYPSYTLKKINGISYGKEGQDISFNKKILQRKHELIRNYDDISYNRTVAYNYLHEHSDVPGLIRKIAVLLDIDYTPRPSLSETITQANSGFGIFTFKQRTDFINEKLNKLYGEDAEDIIAADELLIIDEEVHTISDDYFFFSNSKNVLQEVLRLGVVRNNYQIKSTDDSRDQSCYILFSNQNRMTNVVHKSTSYSQAEKDISACIQYLKKLSQQSEGLYYVEHLLLAPPYQGNHFGFIIKTETQAGEELIFKQYQLENYKTRNKWVKLLYDNIGNDDCLQYRINRVEDKYVIRILDNEGTIVAQSEKRYELEEARKILEENSDSGEQDSGVLNLCLDDITFISNYGDGLDEDESFFSFRISFILPAWPVRFQDANFRSTFNSLLFEHAPAHIAHNSYWLGVEEIAAFEENYGDWKFYLSKTEAVEERLKQAYELINKIKSYSKL